MLNQLRHRVWRRLRRPSVGNEKVQCPNVRHTSTDVFDLPNDLILKISGNLNIRDLNSFHQTSSVIFELLSPALLVRGANGIIYTNKGKTRRTILHWASGYGYKSLVEKLLRHGANIHVNRPDNQGMCPISSASLCGHTAVVKLLFENGADIEAMEMNGYTPLLFASMNGDHQTVKLLLELGADIESRGRAPATWTAMHYAAALGKSTVVDLLLNMGSNLGAIDIGGMVPAQSATIVGEVGIAQLLSAHRGAGTDPRVCLSDYKLCLKILKVAKLHLIWRLYWETGSYEILNEVDRDASLHYR